MTEAIKGMSRGFKSSEFFVTMFCLFVYCVGAFFKENDQFASVATICLVYVGGRSAVKTMKGEK